MARLLRGEAVEAVSRDIQVPAYEVETCRRALMDAGIAARTTRGDRERER